MSDNDEDPFEEIGDDSQRRGDPFDRLAPDAGEGDEPGPDGTDEEAAIGDETQGGDPFDRLGGPGGQAGDGDAGGTGDRLDPFADLEQARGADGTPFEDAESVSVFEDRGVEEMEPDAVWERLRSSRESGGESEERTYAEVSKHRYCEQCEYFSDPPDVSCSHGGTEILEFLDAETVRVVNCPVVAERQALGQRE